MKEALEEKPEQGLDDKLGDVHINVLPRKQLIICFGTMALALFASFADLSSITVALPTIAQDLHADQTINWAGTANLLANCVCQVLFGRFADIFGRKLILLASLAILCVSNLLCGFAHSGVEFYVYRALAGIGLGGTMSLTMVITSDIVTLKQRGKYQGILGSMIGLLNLVLPLIMAAFIRHSTWRDFYRLTPPLCFVIMINTYMFIPSTDKRLNDVLTNKQKFGKIDYFGLLFSTASLTLLLIPISGGGSTYRWDSTLVIVLFVVGGVCFFGFLVIEWKVPELPMIPLRLFKLPLLCLILLSNFFIGAAFFSFSYFVPYYQQIVRGYSVTKLLVLLFSLSVPIAVLLTIAGRFVSWSGHYIHVMYTGYITWLVAQCVTLTWNQHTSVAAQVVVLIIMGFGVGMIFQPTMVAAQAQAKKADRAVVISARNVIRSFGGAVGIAVSSLIVSNTLLKEVNAQLEQDLVVPEAYLHYLKAHIYSHVDVTSLTAEQLHVVRTMYMKAIRNFFYLLVPLLAVCLLSCLLVRDNGLQCLDEEKLDEEDNIERVKNKVRRWMKREGKLPL